MKRKYKFLILLMSVGIMTPMMKVNAATLTFEKLKYNGNLIQKVQNGEIYENINIHKQWIDNNGTKQYAFCLEPATYIREGEVTQSNLLDYFKQGLSETQAKALVKKINEYTRFGYNANSTVKGTDNYYLATQKLIWEEIAKTGFYESDYYQGILKAAGTELKPIETIEYTYENSGSNDVIIKITDEISKIKSDITNYYKKPSFCSSKNKIELAVDETATYTDSNKVLSNYTVKCGSGLECKQEENKLIVTAKAVGNQTITFTKANSGSDAVVYRYDDNQRVVTSGGKLEAVSCSFGLDTYKNVQTSDIKIIPIISIGLICGIVAYLIYYSKNKLKDVK